MNDVIKSVDFVFLFIIVVSIVILVGLTVTMIYFLVKYNRKKNPNPVDIKSNLPLEITWTVIPTILVIMMFYYGYVGFEKMRNVPDGAMEVKVTARMWSWSFTYPNGKKSGELVVPEGKPVKLLLHSEDVLHSFYAPAFRIKEDCVPGLETYTWFVPEGIGEYDVFCAEYCGKGHSSMITKIKVLSQHEFDEWYTGKEEITKEGKVDVKALMEEHGCTGCHTFDGTADIAPSFKGVASRSRTVVEGGKEFEVKTTRQYIVESILEPEKKVVKGFEPSMPSFKDELSSEEIEEIAEFLLKQK